MGVYIYPMNDTITVKLPPAVMSEVRFEAESMEAATSEDIGTTWRALLDKVRATRGNTLTLSTPEARQLQASLINTVDCLEDRAKGGDAEARRVLRSVNRFLPKLESIPKRR